MNSSFEHISHLQYKVKALQAKVSAFESGKQYIKMQEEFESRLSGKKREIKGLKSDLARANSQLVTMRNNWLQVFADVEKEYAMALLEKDRQLQQMEKQWQKAEAAHDVTLARLREKSRECYQAQTELEEEKERVQKLKAQLNRNHENSSIASSMKPNHKKIPNNRIQTGKKPGGQPGHKGHPRKRHAPTSTIHIPPPKEYTENPNYKPTGKTIVKQIVGLSIRLIVDEYQTPEYKNLQTGKRVHADFPLGIVNELTYAGSIKAFAFLLNNRCHVSIDKVRELLSELTNGELQISKGMINGLSKEFSKKTQTEQQKSFSDLLLCPVLNTDFTGVRFDGKNAHVAVCTAEDTVMYFARKHKGHKGVKGTPVEDYQGILVHDHDKTFYKYGSQHQECLAHVLRYLKGSMENELHLKWNRQMRELIQELIHYRNKLPPDSDPDTKKVEAYEARYRQILCLAKEEYEYEPPSDYYKDGYNLYKRLEKYKDNHLLFLYDVRVPTNNNQSERLLRIIKRKQRQVMTFRSFDSLEHLCDSMGVLASLQAQGRNIYTSVASIFD